MQRVTDFVQANLSTMPDVDWERAYFARFGALRTQKALPGFLAELKQANAGYYHRQEVSPKAYAYLCFFWMTLDACAQDKNGGFEIVLALCGTLIQGMLTEEMARGFDAALKADRERLEQNPALLAQMRASSPDLARALQSDPSERMQRAELVHMPLLLMRTLLRKQAIGPIRQLITGLYTACEPALTLLVNESMTEDAWLMQVCDTLPLLMLKNFVPLQDRTQSQAPVEVFVNAENMSPSIEEETSYPLSPLFRELFSEQEIREFQAQDQRIAETFANLFPLTYINRPRLFAFIREDVERVAQQQGRDAGRQQAANYYQGWFYIPRYFYEQLGAELGGASAAGGATRMAGAGSAPAQTAAPHAPAPHGFDLGGKLADMQSGLRRFLHLDADDKT